MTETLKYRKDDINIKSRFSSQINKNKQLIKSSKYLPKTDATVNEIKNLRKENSKLKVEYRNKKKSIYSLNKKIVKEYSIALKSTKHLFNEEKRTCSKQKYDYYKNEITNLKLRRKNASIEKYRRVFGSSDGKTWKEKSGTYGRIAIIIGLFILFMVPIWLIMVYSSKTNIESASVEKGEIFIPSFNGGATDNYNLAMENLKFWDSLFNTLFLTIVSNILILIFASMAAWQLVRKQTWYSKVIFYFFVVAMILPFQAIMVPLVSQFVKLELNVSLVGTSIAYIGFGMALSIFMMHGFLKTVPMALEESATISGMNPLQVYFHVVLPMLKTTFVTILVLNIMWIWNDYLLPSLLLNDQYGPQTLQVRLIQSLASSVSQDLKALSAGVTLLLVPPVIFFVFAQKKMISGITKGAIK